MLRKVSPVYCTKLFISARFMCIMKLENNKEQKMELSEKIQKIRKENNLTQEQFAERIFVSRTAVSKWETGRGIPSIDSLQMIAKEFNLRLDDLLSTEEIVNIAKEENKANILKLTSYIDVIINLCAILGVVLPLYKTNSNGVYYSTYVTNIDGWQGTAFLSFPIFISALGILQLITILLGTKSFSKIIAICADAAMTLEILWLIICLQPYPAIFFFFLLALKVILKIKKH